MNIPEPPAPDAPAAEMARFAFKMGLRAAISAGVTDDELQELITEAKAEFAAVTETT